VPCSSSMFVWGTAIAITPTALEVIERSEMTRALHAEPAISDCFLPYMLSRKPDRGGPNQPHLQVQREPTCPRSSAARGEGESAQAAQICRNIASDGPSNFRA
jgi:hypothetical protein